MARIYANLIEKGLKSLDDIPNKLKDAVKQILKDDGYLTDSTISVEQ